MLIKRITILIYFIIMITGIFLLITTDFNYSIDIIISGIIPIFISLPEMIIYKVNSRKSIYISLLDLLTEIWFAKQTLNFAKNNTPNISTEMIEKHYNSLNKIYNNLMSYDYHVFVINRKKYVDLVTKLQTKISILNTSKSSIDYCITKYKYDIGINNMPEMKKDTIEMNRQIEVMTTIYDDIMSLLNEYSDKCYSSKEKYSWSNKISNLNNAYLQEETRIKI